MSDNNVKYSNKDLKKLDCDMFKKKPTFESKMSLY